MTKKSKSNKVQGIEAAFNALLVINNALKKLSKKKREWVLRTLTTYFQEEDNK